jgi:hypothetical protein
MPYGIAKVLRSLPSGALSSLATTPIYKIYAVGIKRKIQKSNGQVYAPVQGNHTGLPLRAAWNHRQQNMRGVFFIMVNDLCGFNEFGACAKRLASV